MGLFGGFCAVTFPARGLDECVTLVVGGQGDSLVGISSIDGKDSSENETRAFHPFETEVWYQIRLVSDGEKLVDLDTTSKTLSLRQGGIEECVLFGLATWQTTAQIRDVRWRGL